jgi:hypothetical protein
VRDRHLERRPVVSAMSATSPLKPTPNMALQRTRRPRFRSGRSVRSLGSSLNARLLGGLGERDSRVSFAIGLGLLVALGLACDSDPAPEVLSLATPTPLQAFRLSEISLEQRGSMGRFPSFGLVLHRDGTATYVGDAYSERKGRYSPRW